MPCRGRLGLRCLVQDSLQKLGGGSPTRQKYNCQIFRARDDIVGNVELR